MVAIICIIASRYINPKPDTKFSRRSAMHQGHSMKKISIAVAGIVSSVVFGCVGIAGAETLRIGGTGVALGGMTLLGAAFEEKNPGVSVEVLPSLGSSGGVKALVAGAIDLAVSSRPVKEKESAKGAIGELYATTRLVIVTSQSTDADKITMSQLVGAYSGTTTQWPSGPPIRLVLRPVSETDTKLLRDLSADMRAALDQAQKRPGLVSATNDQDNAETLERLDGSLGLIALGQIATENRKLKVLPLVEEDEPAGGAIKQPATFYKHLYLVKTSGIKPVASDFLSYVFSAEGQALLVKFDHIQVR